MTVSSQVRSITLALAIGATGGLVAVFLNIPLALLLGPLFATMVAGLAGARINVPDGLRTSVMTILGAFLASKFTPDVVTSMAQWPLSLASVPLYIAISTAIAGFYFHRVAKLDRISSIFAAVPGGLMVMIAIGGTSGGDERRIAISHILRIVIAVFIVTFILWGVFDVQRDQSDMLTSGLDADMVQLGMVMLIAGLGTYVAHRMGLPAPQFLGPLVCIAPLYITATVTVAIPGPLLAVGLWVLGCSIGSRFAGFDHRILARLAGHTLISVGLLLLISSGTAGLLYLVTGIPFIAGLLAFSPGGIAEMSLIALALDIDPAYVVIHHLLRIGICILAAPVLGTLLKDKSR
ncbi:AbrB family transcriptional regulator [Magnetospira sp. QH-2]|uniref:AbrB family transcriptional regulator n=1 Tax=Magnetospira sp. (strain QH-2) TaxID=1288970 RepID=UPI0003E80ABE|nr:AbrB family transcriptional regulator [Magnetospira sp. QH-2]CCQ75238.1 putative ammonia monooxygenase [Magnetospira sp. QH-2]